MNEGSVAAMVASSSSIFGSLGPGVSEGACWLTNQLRFGRDRSFRLWLTVSFSHLLA